MNKFLAKGDINDPAVAAIIARNKRTAMEAISLIARRNKKKSPTDAMEQIMNTIGMMASEMVFSMGGMGLAHAGACADLVKHHVDGALNLVEAEARDAKLAAERENKT
jgi:hypothetical protein